MVLVFCILPFQFVMIYSWPLSVGFRGYIPVEGLRLEQSVIFAVSHTVTTI